MEFDAVVSDAGFDGEVGALFDSDPFGAGHAVSGKVSQAVRSLRDAVKAKVEADGRPQPASFNVHVSSSGDSFVVSVGAVVGDE